MATIPDILHRLKPKRTIHAISAVFMPCLNDGSPDFANFDGILQRVAGAGLIPAVNMDTGFGPQLSPDQRREVLRFTRAHIGDRPFVAGAMPFGWPGDPLAGYHKDLRAIRDVGALPILFQSPWLTAAEDLAGAYRQILEDTPQALAFELSRAFAPFGRIYDLQTWQRLLAIPALIGAKHSSLDRDMELERLALISRERPDFRLYTGNDLAIDMVMWGSDYLLGLSTFDPEAFAQRDAWWAAGDSRFFALNDALQTLGVIAFRAPVPAYKSSAAIYLSSPARQLLIHPGAPKRGAGEAELLETVRERIAQAMRAGS